MYDAGWEPRRQVANAHPARPPTHHCRPPVPVTARVEWADNGTVQYVATHALGWDGDLVKVDGIPLRRHGFGLNGLWLHADDVERR